MRWTVRDRVNPGSVLFSKIKMALKHHGKGEELGPRPLGRQRLRESICRFVPHLRARRNKSGSIRCVWVMASRLLRGVKNSEAPKI